MPKLTQKYILELVKTKRFIVLIFDRETGKRISTYGGANIISAFNEIARMLPSLDRVVIVLPSDLPQAENLNITLAEALELSKDKRFTWFPFTYF